jgi:hypothetical protein
MNAAKWQEGEEKHLTVAAHSMAMIQKAAIMMQAKKNTTKAGMMITMKMTMMTGRSPVTRRKTKMMTTGMMMKIGMTMMRTTNMTGHSPVTAMKTMIMMSMIAAGVTRKMTGMSEVVCRATVVAVVRRSGMARAADQGMAGPVHHLMTVVLPMEAVHPTEAVRPMETVLPAEAVLPREMVLLPDVKAAGVALQPWILKSSGG